MFVCVRAYMHACVRVCVCVCVFCLCVCVSVSVFVWVDGWEGGPARARS